MGVLRVEFPGEGGVLLLRGAESRFKAIDGGVEHIRRYLAVNDRRGRF